MDDKKIEQLDQRFDKIEDMLRHIHGHVERLQAYGFINKESFVHILRLIIDNLQDILDKKISGEELANKFYEFQKSSSKIAEDYYSPIDEKDKEEHEQMVHEREKFRKD